MSSKTYNKALEIINNRRVRAKSENDRHFSEIERQIPEVAEINRQLSFTSIEILKAINSGNNTLGQLKAMEVKNRQAQEMIASLLVSRGYPADYLDIKFTCSKCSDTGFYDGKRCSCLEELIGKLSVQELNESSPLKLCSFETFDLSYFKGIQTNEDDDCYTTMSNNLDYCRRYVSTFSRTSRNIFISGKTGLGKTHLSLAIAERLLNQGWDVLYDSTINYLTKIESEYYGRSEGDTLNILLNADLLILDDLGSEYEKAFYTSTIYNIINTRLNKGIPTIISTNLTPAEIEPRYDARIVSRLLTMYDYLKFTGKDVRAIKAGRNTRESINMYGKNL